MILFYLVTQLKWKLKHGFSETWTFHPFTFENVRERKPFQNAPPIASECLVSIGARAKAIQGHEYKAEISARLLVFGTLNTGALGHQVQSPGQPGDVLYLLIDCFIKTTGSAGGGRGLFCFGRRASVCGGGRESFVRSAPERHARWLGGSLSHGAVRPSLERAFPCRVEAPPFAFAHSGNSSRK